MQDAVRIKKVVLFLLILAGAVMMIYPLLWMLSSSFKPNSIIFKELGLWPSRVTLDNFQQGWRGVGGISFSTFYLNTFMLVVFVIIGNLITCSMTAYAFARLHFSFKKVLFVIVLGTLMLPHHVLLIPQYLLFHSFGWINTYLPLIVPSFLATNSFFIFLMVQFIRGLPKELDQAATVDGCNSFQIYMKIIMPLLLPALVTTTIFTFIWTWNDFFSQLIYISSPKSFTIALALRMFLDSTAESAWGELFAMSSLSLVPIIAIFVFFQRLLIDGISTSGLKG